MANKTSKKNKKKKYTTRLEKNKNIYYKNNSSSISLEKESKKELILIILVISIVLNCILLMIINIKNSSITNLKEQKENYNQEIKNIKENYTNYLFLGDSITEFYDLDKYFKDMRVVNSGVAGDTTDDILNDMKKRVYDYNPSKVLILIGTNDLLEDKTNEEIVDNIKKIVEEIKENRSEAKIYIESIYPINKDMDKKLYTVGKRENSDIIEINKMLKEYCDENKLTFINTYNELLDDDGNLKKEYSKDGLHLSSKGYEIVTDILKKYL